jgi:flavin-dependent dehydrogenase
MSNIVVLFGSGISGLFCGIQCLKAGLEVIILENRSKNYLSPGWISSIERSVFLRYFNRGPYQSELVEETKVNHIISPQGAKTYTVDYEKQYQIRFDTLHENLKREFLELGGQIYYKVPYKDLEINKEDQLWYLKYRRVLFKKKIETPLLVDACGLYSPFRCRFSLEKELLDVDQNWICRTLYGEYKISEDWKIPVSGEKYSIILRHNSYSFQQYLYDKSSDTLKVQIGIIKNKRNSVSISPVSLRAELFHILKINKFFTKIELFRDKPIRHSSLALANDGYLMIGDCAFLTDSQRASGITSAIASAHLAAKAIIYIQKNNLQYNFRNLHAYTHEYMMTRGVKLLLIHGLVRLSLNFNRNELDFLFQKGFIDMNNIVAMIEEDKMLEGPSYFIKKFTPVFKNLKFSYKLAKQLKPYFDLRRHLKAYPYFPSKENLLGYVRETTNLLDKIYRP